MAKAPSLIDILRRSLSESGRMVKHCVGQVGRLLDGEAEVLSAQQRTALMGKDSAMATLTRLMAMQKHLIELAIQLDELERIAQEDERKKAGELKPLTDEDWELLERGVARWREGKEGVDSNPV